jgi:hypothetical protein
VTGDYFVELARLIFLFRVGLAQLQCRSCATGAHAGSPVEPLHVFLERCEGKCFVELVRLIVLFGAGFAQLFVWLTWVFHERWQEESVFELVWFAFLFRVGLTQ